MRRETSEHLRHHAAEVECPYHTHKNAVRELYRAVKKYTVEYKIEFLDPSCYVWRVVPSPCNGGINRFIEWFTGYHFPVSLFIILTSREDNTKVPMRINIANISARDDIQRYLN